MLCFEREDFRLLVMQELLAFTGHWSSSWTLGKEIFVHAVCPGQLGSALLSCVFTLFVLTWLYNVCKFLTLESDLDFRVSFGGV